MSDSRSLRVRCLSVLFGMGLIAAGCGGDAEDAGPAVTVSRTSTPATTAPTTTESTTTTEEVEEDEEEETTTTEVPTTLEFADEDNSSSGNGGNSSGASSGGATATTAAVTTETRAPGDGQTLPPTTAPPTTTPTVTESTIATTSTIDPFAPLVNFDQVVLPYGDAATSVSINSVNLKCDANGISPQLVVVAPFDLSGVQQFVTFYGPSGAAYNVSGQVGSGQLETFTDWRSDPVVADSFDWVAVCSQPSWKVLVELSDAGGGLFSVVVDTTISG